MGDEGRDLQKQEQAEVVNRDYMPSDITNQHFPEPPVHPLSALVTVAIDSLWNLAEFTAIATIAGIPAIPILAIGSGFTCMLAVTLLQRFVSKDAWSSSTAKGFAMGILAGIPTFFSGTVAGGILLLWTGAYAIFNRKQLPPG